MADLSYTVAVKGHEDLPKLAAGIDAVATALGPGKDIAEKLAAFKAAMGGMGGSLDGLNKFEEKLEHIKQTIGGLSNTLQREMKEMRQVAATGAADISAELAKMSAAPKQVLQIPVPKAQDIGQVKQMSSAFQKLTVDGNDVHSMARGLASGFNLLWLTWGKLAPLFAGASISFGLKKTFDIGSEVEYQIKFMETLGQTTKEQGKIIRQALRDIDQTTQFSLVELSQAMVRLGQAGQAPAEALATLKPAADLASVGMTDLKVATDLLIQTQALFGKSAADSGKIAAQIFVATKSGVLNVEDIAGSMRYASEANTRFGKSLEETLAILGALAQAGLKGSAGGTAYINFLRDINGRSGPAVKALADLGKATGKTIEVFDSLGKQRSAVDIFNDIAVAADKLSAKDADKILSRIFSDRGGRTFFAMVREGTIDLQKMVDVLKEVKPEELLKGAQGLMDTTKGALNILQGAMVGALDKVFEVNSDKFKAFIVDITKAIDSKEFLLSVQSMVAGALSLYETIKSLLPVIEALGTAWLVFKAGSFGVAVFQALAQALGGMVPMLATTNAQLLNNTKALFTNTGAWQANGIAVVENAAVQRAAAASQAAGAGALSATAVAAAKAGAAATVTTVGMRALTAVIGFMANPIVGVITTLGLLGYAFWSAKKDATAATADTTENILENGKINLAQWDKEIERLRERNNLMGQTDGYSGAESQIKVAQDSQAKAIADYEKYAKWLEVRTKEGRNIEPKHALVLQQKLNTLKQAEVDINKAQQGIDTARMRDLSAREEKERQAEAKRNASNKPQGSTPLPPSDKPFRGGQKEFDRYADDKSLKAIENQTNSELAALKAGYDAKKVIQDNAYKNMLVSQGQYQADALFSTAQYEEESIQAITQGQEKYFDEFVIKYEELRRLRDGEKVDSTFWKQYNAEMDKAINEEVSYHDAGQAKIVAIREEAAKRIKLSMQDIQGETEKLIKADKEYWVKTKGETAKIAALQKVEEQYRNINQSVFSTATAEKAAALAKSESLENSRQQIETMKRELAIRKETVDFLEAEIALRSNLALNKGETWAGFAEAKNMVAALRGSISKLEDQIADGTANAITDGAERGALAYEKEMEAKASSVTDSIAGAIETAIFKSGKEGGKALRDYLQAELIRRPLMAVIKATIQPISSMLVNGVMGGGQSGGGGIAGGIQTASNLNSLYGAGSQALFGGAAGASAASLGYANVVGMAGGDAIGALAAANGMWAGVATGAQAAAQAAIASNAAMAAGTAAALPAGTTAAAAGAGAGAGGASGALAAIPGWGWALAGVAAVAALWDDDSGTLHTGAKAQYSAADGLATTGEGGKKEYGLNVGMVYDKNTADFVGGVAKGLTETFDGLAVAFGQKAGYQVATAFADDSSKDGAWGALRISKDGKDLLNWEDTRTSRWAPKEFADGEAGQKEYLAAIAKDTRTVLLDMDLPSWADTMLESIGDAANMDQLAATVQQIGVIQTTFVQLGKMMEGFAGLTDQAFEALMRASGGFESLAANAGTYYENFYSEAEKTAAVTGEVTAALASVGLQMPKTREEFRAMVESQLALGEGGTKAVAALLGVSGAFASVTAASETAADAAARLAAERGKAAEAAAEAAARAAEEAARRAEEIARERYGLETQIMQLLGDTAGLRMREIEALDASNRALQEHIYTIEDAREAYQKSITAANDAYSGLERSVAAEKTALQAQYELKKKGFSDTLKVQADANSAQIEAARAAADKIRGIASALQNALKSSRVDSSSINAARLSSARNTISGAAESNNLFAPGLESALAVAGADNKQFYGRFEDYAYAQGVTAGEIAKLSANAQAQLSAAESIVNSLSAQNSVAQLISDAEMAALDEWYAQELKKLDDTLTLGKSQLDAMLGIDNSVLSVADAVANLANAINASNAALQAQRAAEAAASLLMSGAYQTFEQTSEQAAGAQPQRTYSDDELRAFGFNLTDIKAYAAFAGASGGADARDGLASVVDNILRQGDDALWSTYGMQHLPTSRGPNGEVYTTLTDKTGKTYDDMKAWADSFTNAQRAAASEAWTNSAAGNGITPQELQTIQQIGSTADRQLYWAGGSLDIGGFAAQDGKHYSSAGIVNAINTVLSQGASVQDVLSGGQANFGLNEEDIRTAARAAGIPGFATGINRVPHDMLARIHKDEAVVPAAYNPYNPGASAPGNSEVVAELRKLNERMARIEASSNATAGHTAGTDRKLARVIQNDAIKTETTV